MILWKRKAILGSLLVMSMGVAACDTGTEAPTATEGDEATATGDTVRLSGAGATFPAPLYQRWFAAYNQDIDSGTQVSYQSVGSGAGLEQYISGTVDFGASDAPIQGDRLESFRSEFNYEPIQVPMAGGAVVLAYNIPGIDDSDLNLSRTTYCHIVTGEITNWNDPAIAADNEGLELPDLPILFSHRSDGSGTSFIFTNHIDSVCPNWQSGAGTSVEWPTGQGGQGNEGVAALVQQNAGAIGYVEYAYARLNEIPVANLENSAGNFIYPSAEAASVAFDGVEVPDDFALLIPDPEGEDAYPIVGLTWILVYRNYDDPQRWEALRNVLEWGLTDGRDITNELDYVPMPDSIVERVRERLNEVQA